MGKAKATRRRALKPMITDRKQVTDKATGTPPLDTATRVSTGRKRVTGPAKLTLTVKPVTAPTTRPVLAMMEMVSPTRSDHEWRSREIA